MAKEPFASKITAIWIGGAFFWMSSGFKGPYSHVISERYTTRNVAVGYVVMLVGALGLVYFIVRHER